MATSMMLVNKGVNTLVDTPESIYKSPSSGNGTIITSVTVANNSTSNKSYKAYIVSAGESAINPQTPFRVVVWADIDLATGTIYITSKVFDEIAGTFFDHYPLH